MDIFAAGANRQTRQEAKPIYDLEHNALRDVIEQQKRVRAEEVQERQRRHEEIARDRERKEASDAEEMLRYLEAMKKMLSEIGRPVESFFINPGGEVITVHRKTETIRVQGLNISSRQMRWISLRKVIEAIIG